MNHWQRRILWITAAVLLLMLLFPPFHGPKGNLNFGYSFITNPPDKLATVNVGTLFIQCLIITGVGAICWFACKDKRESAKEEKKGKDRI